MRTWTTKNKRLRPSALERAQGRFLRGPDGHDGGGEIAVDPPVEPTALGEAVEAAEPLPEPPEPGDSETGESDGGEAAVAKIVPESYELAVPDGMAIDAAAVALATPVFRDLGLSNDDANKLMPVAARWAQKIQDDSNRAILGQVQADRKAWLDAAQADPETGGNNWEGTLAHAARALDQLGFEKGSPFRILLNESGLGNHPEMIRAFAKVGKAIGEDSNFIRGTAAIRSKGDAAETLYPDDQPKGA